MTKKDLDIVFGGVGGMYLMTLVVHEPYAELVPTDMPYRLIPGVVLLSGMVLFWRSLRKWQALRASVSKEAEAKLEMSNKIEDMHQEIESLKAKLDQGKKD